MALLTRVPTPLPERGCLRLGHWLTIIVRGKLAWVALALTALLAVLVLAALVQAALVVLQHDCTCRGL